MNRNRGNPSNPEGDGSVDDQGDTEVDEEPDGPTEEDAATILEEDFDEELELAAVEEQAKETGEKRPNVLVRLYRGETSFDFIGRRKIWFTASAIVILLGIVSLSTRGLNLGIDFKGGQSWLVQSPTLTVAQATAAAESGGATQPTVVQLTDHKTHARQIQITTDLNSKSAAEQMAIEGKVITALARAAHTTPNAIGVQEVGPTWGSEVTDAAIKALIIFFIAVSLYISVRFEFKMAVAAIVAVIHDILVTLGIYSLAGFQVSPDTVVAVLTVLGYSLYDTVVVFDRIRDNAQGSRRVRTDHLLGDGQPVDEPDPGPVDQYVPGGYHAGPVGAGGGLRISGSHVAAGLRAGPGHRSDQRGLLLHLHRFAPPRLDEGTGAPLHHHPPADRNPRRPYRGAHPGHGRGHGRCRWAGRCTGTAPDNRGRSARERPRRPGRERCDQSQEHRHEYPGFGWGDGQHLVIGSATAALGVHPTGRQPATAPARKGKGGKGGKGKRR